MTVITLGFANNDNEFSYNEHLVILSRFPCIKIIYCKVRKFGYKEHPLYNLLFHLLLVVSETQCSFRLGVKIVLSCDFDLKNIYFHCVTNMAIM